MILGDVCFSSAYFGGAKWLEKIKGVCLICWGWNKWEDFASRIVHQIMAIHNWACTVQIWSYLPELSEKKSFEVKRTTMVLWRGNSWFVSVYSSVTDVFSCVLQRLSSLIRDWTCASSFRVYAVLESWFLSCLSGSCFLYRLICILWHVMC